MGMCIYTCCLSLVKNAERMAPRREQMKNRRIAHDSVLLKVAWINRSLHHKLEEWALPRKIESLASGFSMPSKGTS
jgi:hypothetical protein